MTTETTDYKPLEIVDPTVLPEEPYVFGVAFDKDQTFRGLGGCESKCHLKVFAAISGEDRIVVAIATELPDNPGTSITNMVERLAYQTYYLSSSQGHPTTKFGWIEHCPDSDMKYSWVSFEVDEINWNEFKNPSWHTCTKEEIEAFLGHKID